MQILIHLVGVSNGSVSLATPANDAASAASSSATTASNAASHKKDVWIFTEEELQNSPSRKCGVTLEEETRYRQKAVDYMKRVGKKLRLYVNKIEYRKKAQNHFFPYLFISFPMYSIFKLFAFRSCSFITAFLQSKKLFFVMQQRTSICMPHKMIPQETIRRNCDSNCFF